MIQGLTLPMAEHAPEREYGGGHWDFPFCGFGYFLDRFFGFCAKRLFGFGVRCGLRIFRFLASGFRFSKKIIAVFRFYYILYGLKCILNLSPAQK